jgi:hypothetical protein
MAGSAPGDGGGETNREDKEMMNRKRTAIGLAMLTLLAAGAVGVLATFAHSEGINGEFTAFETPSGKHVKATYDSVNIGVPPTFETTNGKVECKNAVLNANSAGGTDQNLTFTGSYTECDLVEPVVLPATVIMNGCDYDFDQPIEQKKDEYSGAINLNCPAGKSIEIKIFDVGNTQLHSGLICTITFLPEKMMTKTTYEDQTKATPTDFTLKAEIKKMPYEEDGAEGNCPDEVGQKFANGELEGQATVKATDGTGKQIDTSVD